jgi:hypothetical protein
MAVRHTEGDIDLMLVKGISLVLSIPLPELLTIVIPGRIVLSSMYMVRLLSFFKFLPIEHGLTAWKNNAQLSTPLEPATAVKVSFFFTAHLRLNSKTSSKSSASSFAAHTTIKNTRNHHFQSSSTKHSLNKQT